VQAVVLVGGFGTRLRPLTNTVNKQMLPVVDRPMIEHVLAGLAAHGVTDAVLSLGYAPDTFVEAYPDRTCAGVRLEFAVEDQPLDTAGAIRFAATEAGIADTFLVVNGDVLHDVDVGAVWRSHQERGAEGTITLTPVEDPSRYGVVPLDDDGRVQAFIEKPPVGEAPTNWINAGIYVLEPSVLDRIAPVGKVSIERATFPAMVADGGLYGVQSEAYWIDAGTPATYLQAQLDLVGGLRAGAVPAAVAGSAVVDGTAEGSVVMHDVVIAEGATVQGSAVLPGAVVEKAAQVVGSIVGPGATVGEGATVVGLSVLGDGAQVEPGAHLDGARLPDPDAQEG
jgi:mannose-1-phosphate guanylyltransferase